MNTRTDELWPVVKELTDGRGVRSAFDAVGLQASFESALSTVCRGGTVTVIGNLAPKVDAPLQYLVTRQIRVQGSNASAGEYPACLEMIRRGAIDLDPIVSAVAPLSEGAKWFQRLYKGDEGLMKVILKPGT